MASILVLPTPGRPVGALARLFGRWRALRRLARYRRTSRLRQKGLERWAADYSRHGR